MSKTTSAGTKLPKGKGADQSKGRSYQSHEEQSQDQAQPGKFTGPHADTLTLQRLVGNQAVSSIIQPKLKVGNPGDRSGILQRKCASCGQDTIAGGECGECAKNKIGLQRKLTIGASNDPLEQEADQVADQVLAAPAYPAVSGTLPHIQRLSGQQTGQAADATASASVDHVLSSPGMPLEPSLQQDMEQRFGHDFSRVRVHTNAAAERSARDVNANAYTMGHDIVFGVGRFMPGTSEGRRLIAHELTHVVQQSHIVGSPSTLQRKGGKGPGSCGWLDEATATALGGVAHVQIQERLLSRGYVPEMPIPRATKTDGIGSRRCQPLGTSPGYADVARITRPIVGISEIKPFWNASVVGRAEAMHYRLRADQSKQRLTGVGICGMRGAGPDDVAFNVQVGPLTTASSFTLLKGAITGTEDFGPFQKDPMRNLWAREVSAGTIGYWCKLNEEGKKKKKEEEQKKKKEKEEKKRMKEEEKQRKKKEKEKGKREKGKGEEKPKEKPKEEPKKPKEEPKAKPSGGAGNVGFGISIFSSSVGGANAGVGISVGSNSAAVGTAGAGISWFSDSAAAGAVGAGVSVDSMGAGVGVAGAGVTQDSESVAAGAAGVGQSKGATTAGVGVAGAGKIEDSQSAAAGAAGTGEVKDSTTASAGSAASGRQEGVTGAGTGSPKKPIDPKDVTGPNSDKVPEGHGDAEVAPGREGTPGDTARQADKPASGDVPGGDKEAGSGTDVRGQQKAPGVGTGQGTGTGAKKDGGDSTGYQGAGGSTVKTGTPGTQVIPVTGTTGDAKQSGIPVGGQTGASGSNQGTNTPGNAPGKAQGTGSGAGKVDLGVMPVFPWGASDADREKIGAEAAKVAVMMQKATPAQKLLLQHLANINPTGQYMVPASDWVNKLLKVTAGLTPDEIEFIKNLDWKPGSISEDELRERLRKALADRDKTLPLKGEGDVTKPTPKKTSEGGSGGGIGKAADKNKDTGKSASGDKSSPDAQGPPKGATDKVTVPPAGSNRSTAGIFAFQILSGMSRSSNLKPNDVVECRIRVEDQGRVFELAGVNVTFISRADTEEVDKGVKFIKTVFKVQFTKDFWSEKNKFYGKGGVESLTDYDFGRLRAK